MKSFISIYTMIVLFFASTFIGATLQSVDHKVITVLDNTSQGISFLKKAPSNSSNQSHTVFFAAHSPLENNSEQEDNENEEEDNLEKDIDLITSHFSPWRTHREENLIPSNKSKVTFRSQKVWRPPQNILV